MGCRVSYDAFIIIHLTYLAGKCESQLRAKNKKDDLIEESWAFQFLFLSTFNVHFADE